MKKVYLLLLSVILLMNIETSAQCTNTSQYPSGTIPINASGTATTISTCSFGGEYSVVSGAVNGQTLRFTSSVATDIITIHSGSSNGPVIAFGTTPLVFANGYTGTVYAHWNTPGCGSDFSCRTTTVQCTSCSTPVGCTNTSSFGSATINPTGTIVTVSTCSFAGEYSTINGAVNGQTLNFTSSVGTDFITIHSGTSNGPIIASGTTPLSFANTFTGTIYAHWNTPGCGSDFSCRTTTVQCTSCTAPPPPANDLCPGAISIACGQTITGSTTNATVDAVGTCNFVNLGTARGVWYTFVGDGTTNILSLCGSTFDTEIGVFSGSCGSLSCVTANDDNCGLQSQVTFPTVLGTTYYVLVTGWSTSSGNFTLNRTCSCSGVPSPGVISGPAGTVCFGTPATLTLGGYTTGLGISIQWKSSTTPGGPYTNIAGATASTYAASPGGTTYYVATVTCASSGFNATTAEFVLNISRPVHSNVIATPAVGCAPASTVITGTVSGGVTTGNYTHLLTGPATITQNASSGPNNSNASFTVTNMPAGTHTFTLRSTDAAGCFVTTNVIVVVNPTPVITIIPTTATICNGVIQRIDASGSIIQQTFTNLTNIHTPAPPTTSGIADPYPTSVAVSGLPTTGASVNSVTLGTYYHPNPDDVDVVLVSPTGQSVILMSDCGGANAASGQTFILSDAAVSFLSDNGFNATGTYKPSNYDAVDIWPAPGPGATPTSVTLSSFTGNMNGTWSLYVVDDNTGNAGLISTWSMTFNLPSPVVFSPTTNLFTDAAATVPYTGALVYTVWARPTSTTTYTASYTSNGCTGSATSVLTVNQLPAITASPVNVAASCPGFNVTYSVTATGTGLTYQWQVSTNGGGTWTNLTNSPLTYAGVTTNVLTVINPQASQDNYQYRVVVSGTCAPSVTSGVVTMRIGTPPTITSLTTNPAVPTICQGGNITFTVVAAGSPIAPNIYQWQVSTNGGTTWTNLTTGGSYTPVFTITGATVAQSGGLYRVIVTNPCGQTVTSTNITLTVNAIPTVTAAAITNRICISDTLVPLTGTPSGGSWSGLGISGFNFVPRATGIGTFPITYSFTNTAGCTNTSTINIKVEDCGERIRRLIDNGVLVYPNPNNGRFNIKVNSTLYNYLGMKVYNTAGETVWTQYFNSLVYARVVPVNLSRLPNGTYIVKIYYDDGIRTSEKSFRMVIQK